MENRLAGAHTFTLKDKLLAEIPEGDDSCEGIKQAQEGIERFGLSSIILGISAAHKQYIDPTHEFDLSVLNEKLRNEFLFNKKMELEQGMSRENARIFRILHIYPGRSDQILLWN